MLNVVLPNTGPGLTRLLHHTRNAEGFPTLKLSLAAQGPDGLVTYQIITLYNVFLDQARRGTDTTTVTFTATLADVEIATLGEDGFIDLGGAGALGDPAPGFTEVILDAGTNDVVRGTSSNDQLNGGNGDDDLSGAEGFDILSGGAGNDTLRLSDLGDLVDGGDGIDTIDMSGYDGPQGLDINLTAGSVISAGAARRVAFVDVDNAVGSRRDDTITGSASDNVIEGGGGADTVGGGLGIDVLTGNAGVDSFRFISFEAMDGDVIRDFGAGESVDFRNAGVVGFGAFDGTAGMLRFRTQGGNGFLEADIDGDSAVDFTPMLNGVGVFDAGSLVF